MFNGLLYTLYFKSLKYRMPRGSMKKSVVVPAKSKGGLATTKGVFKWALTTAARYEQRNHSHVLEAQPSAAQAVLPKYTKRGYTFSLQSECVCHCNNTELRKGATD